MAGIGRGKKIDLTGQSFSYLTVIKRTIPKTAKQTNHIYEAWECLCECGTIVTVTGKQLRRGQKSCGCHKYDGLWTKQSSDEDININKIISHYKNRAKTKLKLPWLLSFDEAKILLLSSCFYCGQEPSREFSRDLTTQSIKVSGIDRCDNAIGYTNTNTVSCCMICNRAKNNMPQKEFQDWIDRLKTK